MDLIEPYIGSAEPISDTPISDGTHTYLGGTYHWHSTATQNGELGTARIAYNLEGPNQKCSTKGELLEWTWPDIESVSTDWSATYSNYTRCIIGLPHIDRPL